MKACPACNRPTAPGAWCAEGHPPRRAPRPTGQEKAEAQRLAQETQARLKRQAWARREYRGVLEISAHRRWLYRRGELRAELDACVAAEVLTPDDADRLEAETAAAVIEEAYSRARREVEREAREAARGEAEPCRFETIDPASIGSSAERPTVERLEEVREVLRRKAEERPRLLGGGYRSRVWAMSPLLVAMMLGAMPPGRDEG